MAIISLITGFGKDKGGFRISFPHKKGGLWVTGDPIFLKGFLKYLEAPLGVGGRLKILGEQCVFWTREVWKILGGKGVFCAQKKGRLKL